jgi:hypothetical protein
MKKEEKYILEGIVPKFFSNQPTYPGRIYGMYDWNGKKWIVNEKFCLDNNIDISKIKK